MAGRPKGSKYNVMLSVLMDENMSQDIERLCKQFKVTKAEFMRKAANLLIERINSKLAEQDKKS